MSSSILANEINQGAPLLLARLAAHVESRLRGSVHDFCIQLRDNGLVLLGWTRTYYAKQLAQQCVMELTNLPMANEIEVLDECGSRRSDD